MDEHTLLKSRRFQVSRLRYDSGLGAAITKDVVRHPGSVAIVPVLDDGRICLIRNWRASVAETLIEIPAGTLTPGEDPLSCAQRELAEETGFSAATWQPMGSILAAPGILDERMHLFVASDLTAGTAQLEPDEQIENLIATTDEALAMIDDGRIEDAKTIVGLLRFLRTKNAAI